MIRRSGLRRPGTDQGKAEADVRPEPCKRGPRGAEYPLQAFDVAVTVTSDYADIDMVCGPVDNGSAVAVGITQRSA